MIRNIGTIPKINPPKHIIIKIAGTFFLNTEDKNVPIPPTIKITTIP